VHAKIVEFTVLKSYHFQRVLEQTLRAENTSEGTVKVRRLGPP
jgi:hypothetical protein